MDANSNGTDIRPFVKPAVNYASAEKLEGFLHSLPELVDFNAVNNTFHPFCVQVKSTPPRSFDTITHGEFKVAVSRCAAWLKENLSLSPAVIPNPLAKMAPVALFMESDFGLVVHEFALMSLGVPPLVLSPRLSPVAIGALLQQTGATCFIVSKRLSEPAKPALAALAAKGIVTRIANTYSPYYYEKGSDPLSVTAFDPPEDLDSVILLLHSSGTTGLPKPIPLTHRQLLFAVNCHSFHTEEQAQGLNLSTLPLFHGFGLVAPGLSMSAGKTTLYPAADGIPNAQSILKLIKDMRPKSMMTVPFLLDDLANLPNDEGIKALSHMDFVGTGGAALAAGVGDRLTEGGVRILNFYGTTETGPLSLVFVPTDKYDWKYFRLRTDVKHAVDELSVTGDDGSKRYRLTVWAHPAGRTEGFEISDQLIRNEDYPETDFAPVGRSDDIIVLATGEKANPLILETMLSELPFVKSAIAFGENQFHIGVIIEPVEPLSSADQELEFRNKIWPTIEAAGQKMDNYARIPSPDAIVLVPKEFVIPRTDKGSIARKETYALLDKEIQAVYEKLQQAATDAVAEPLDLDRLEQSLKDLIHKALGLIRPAAPPPDWTIDSSVFDLGVDSLQSLQIRRILIAAVSKTAGLDSLPADKLIPPEFFYLNPSVREMASAIRSPSSAPSNPLLTAAEEVKNFISLYSPVPPLSPSVQSSLPLAPFKNSTIILTGSSGSLGSHLLFTLARSPQVDRIICLIRVSNGGHPSPVPGKFEPNHPTLASRGLELSPAELSKIVTLEIDPQADKLGLIAPVYARLQSTVTHVIHAAWPMNYLMKLRSFEGQFKFLRGLLDLALDRTTKAAQGQSSLLKPRFVLVSSIATVARLAAAAGQPGLPIAERAVADVGEAVCGIGYADGKLVCEKMMEAYGNGGMVVRCGQLAGAKGTGVWNVGEQVPMMIKTVQELGARPELEGSLSWIPVDVAAKVLVEMLEGEKDEGMPRVLHLENPVRQGWEGVMKIVAEELGVNEVVGFEEWLGRVEAAGVGDGKDAEGRYPVQKLLYFFRNAFRTVACGQVTLGTDIARTYSRTLREQGAVDEATVQGYIKFWKKIGYLSK